MNSNNNTTSTNKKVWNIVSTVMTVLIVLLAITLVGSRLMGYRVFSIVSGSMEPTYHVGDLIYVKEVNPDVVKEGDVITFVLNEDLVVATHRVVTVDAANSHFYTKGDNNDVPDAAPVHFNNLIGIPKIRIPLLGYVSEWVQNPPGVYIAIGFCVILLAAVFLPDLIAKTKKKEKSEM